MLQIKNSVDRIVVGGIQCTSFTFTQVSGTLFNYYKCGSNGKPL